MDIFGIRLYPQTLRISKGVGAPILVHHPVTKDFSDFYYIFRPFETAWDSCCFAVDFAARLNEDGTIDDPAPKLREQYGSSLIAADNESQVAIVGSNGFFLQSRHRRFCEGAFLPVFDEVPTFEFLKQLFWGRDFKLTPTTWPQNLRCLVHMWDDVYWQLFSRDPVDMDMLIKSHCADPRLKMYHVDLDREFPNPSNEALREVISL